MSLISDLYLDIGECDRQFGIDFNTCFSKELQSLSPLELDGLVQMSPQKISVTSAGRPFLRNICMPFDAYLQDHKGDEPPPSYSTTV